MSDPLAKRRKLAVHRGAYRLRAGDFSPVEGAACDPTAEDDVCSDEVKHGRQVEDPAMLDGSILDVGSGIAGLMPVELPDPTDGPGTPGSGGCGGCG